MYAIVVAVDLVDVILADLLMWLIVDH